MQAGNEVEEQNENPPSLDSSLEAVFGPGATQLSKELENNSDKKEELIISDTEHDSDSEVEHLNGSSPTKDQRKKRVRKNMKQLFNFSFKDLGIFVPHDVFWWTVIFDPFRYQMVGNCSTFFIVKETGGFEFAECVA